MLDKIVVCGASGFVGTHLVNSLVKAGHEVRAVMSPRRTEVEFVDAETVWADLHDPRECERVLKDAQWVFNLAAKVGGIDYISKHKATCMQSSLINTNLLRAARAARVSRFFFASSSCVYPDGIEVLKEENAYPAAPIDGYGWEKLFSERMCLAFMEEYGVPVSIARYHGLYGPGDIRAKSQDHVIAALCRKVVEAKLSGRHEINIWGDGFQTRSFLFIDDCIEGTTRMTFNGVTGPLNLANCECVSINELVTMLEEIAGVHLNRYYDLTASQGRKHKCSDNEAIRRELNWEPMTPIQQGLAQTYRYCWDRMVTK